MISKMFCWRQQNILNGHQCRQRMVLRPVSGCGIEQDVAHMNLIGIEVKTPDRTVVLDEENDVGNRSASL